MNGKLAMLEHVTNLVADTKVNSKPMMKDNSTIRRESLKQALGCFVGGDDVAFAMSKYDQLAPHGENVAEAVALNMLGLHEAKAGVSEYIAGQLAKLGAAPEVEKDAVKRFKQLVARLNQNIVKGGIIIDGKDLSTLGHEATIKVAPCMREQMFSYTASAKHQVDGKEYKTFGLETIGGGRTK